MGFFSKLFGIDDEEFDEEYEEEYEEQQRSEKNLDILSERFHKHEPSVDTENSDFSFHIIHADSSDVFHEVAHVLKDGNCVALSIKGMDPQEAQRLTDCICGVIYALDGHIEIEATKPDVLILTPKNIEISRGNYASIFTRLAAL